MTDEYLCLTMLSRENEKEAGFKARLSAFWTHMLREHEADFEKVYAETASFEKKENCLSRKYLFEAVIADTLERELRKGDMDFEPIDEADLYSKFEASPPDWFWIEH